MNHNELGQANGLKHQHNEEKDGSADEEAEKDLFRQVSSEVPAQYSGRDRYRQWLSFRLRLISRPSYTPTHCLGKLKRRAAPIL